MRLGLSMGIGTSAPKWDPKGAGDALQMWYDASDEDTVTTNGSGVIQLEDKSGNGYTMEQVTPGKEPTLGLIHGRQAIDFTTGQLLRSLTGPPAYDGAPVFVMAAMSSTTVVNNRDIIWVEGNLDSFHLRIAANGRVRFFRGVAGASSAGVDPHVDGFAIVSGHGDGSDHYGAVFGKEGGPEVSSAVGVAENWVLGSNQLETSTLAGQLGEVFLFSDDSLGLREAALRYLQEKWDPAG